MSQPGLIGREFGNYRIEAHLGTGGMGQVYRARHQHLNWVAAVKVLHAHLATDALFRARFLQEARAVAMLEHPNIVRLFDFGQQDGQLYLVMELLTDGSLRSLLGDRTDPGAGWSLPVGIDLVRQAADGLTYAHERGMVHRDIKPDNLLLQATPDIERRFIGKLADFGLARLGDGGMMTASGVTLGTPAYMSPEQCQGTRVDGRSDIYSLGIVLYEVVTGRLPFRTRSVSDAIYNHVYVAPPPPRLIHPGVSDALETVILRCLAKHPDERYQSMTEFAASLDAAAATLPPDRPASMAVPPGEVLRYELDAPIATAIEGVPESPTPPALPAAQSVARSLAIDSAGATVPRVYVVNAGGEVIESADLTGDGLTVGRLADNRLVLDVDGVSRHHLLIDWDGNRAHVTDIGSSHGTTMAGAPIPAHVLRDWNPRDTVRIGGLQLRLVVPAAAATGVRRSDAITDPAPAAARHIDRRWLFLGAAGVAIVALVVLAALLVPGGNGDDDLGSAGATSTGGIAAVSNPTASSAAETGAPSTAASSAPTSEPGESSTTSTIGADSMTPTAQTAQATPATGAEWIAETSADPAVGPLIGQPLGDPVEVRTPYQEFERGLIVSLVDVVDGGGLLVAVTNTDNPEAGNFTYYDTVGLDSVVLENPDPPDGFYPPARPVAAIWQAVPGLRDEIGWATMEDPGSQVVYQRFERGTVVFLADTYRTWVFYGELALDSSNAWRSFWNEIEAPDETAVYGLQQIARVSEFGEVSGRLGTSLTDAQPIEIPYQVFEHGLMFTTDFLAIDDPAAAGYVVTLVADAGDEDGSWRSDSLVTVMLDPNTTPPGTPPVGLYEPGYPFEIILQHNPDLSAALGWAGTSGLSSKAAWQRFDHGFIIWFADSYRSWVIPSDSNLATGGIWWSYSDE